jgi:hypothetical protein
MSGQRPGGGGRLPAKMADLPSHFFFLKFFALFP